MKLPRIPLPSLGLQGWIIVGCVGFVLFIGAGFARPSFMGLQFDPFGLDQRTIDHLTTDRDQEASNGIARGLEVEGEREQAARVDTYHTQVIEVRDFTARAETEARSAPDASDPLPADLAGGLGEHQRRLCLARPGVCGAASPVPASGRDPAL